MYIALVIVVVAIGLGLVIHSSQSKKHSGAQSSTINTAVSTTSVNIQNYMFEPMAITVKAGSTVTWTNQDSVHHTVTADTPSDNAPNGPLIGQGETYSFTFNKPGTYDFHCMPHANMHGTVIVTN